jgi:hypothetical protein
MSRFNFDDIHRWRSLKPWKRHSLVLLVAGLAYVFIGISYIYAEPSPTREVALRYALNWLPLSGWGLWFIATGLITIISSRWPPVSRTWGYTLLTGLSVAWGGFYLVGIMFGHSPITNISGAIVWGTFGFLWWAISGLVDPTDPQHGQV